MKSCKEGDELPFMPFWVRDWIEDEEIQNMSGQTMASYLWLLCWNWIRGTLSDDPSTLLRLIPATLRNHWLTETWPHLRHHFQPIEGQPGRLTSKRLKRVRDEVLHKQEGHRLGADITNAKRSAKRIAKLVAERIASKMGDADADEENIGPGGPVCVPSKDVKTEGETPLVKWNALAARFGLRKLGKWTMARQKALLGRLREHPDFWARVEAELPRLGRFAKEKGFIDFDFVTRPSKLEPFLEGKHRDHAAVVAVDTTRPQVRELLKHVGAVIEADIGPGLQRYTVLSAGLMAEDRKVTFFHKLDDGQLNNALGAAEGTHADHA